MRRCSGGEKESDGFARLGAENDGASKDVARLASVAVDVENAASAITVGVRQDFVSHGVRNERTVSSGEGVGNGGEGGVEIRVRHAAAFARAAEMAGAAAV